MDSFVRIFGTIGLITNQLTKRDRVYDDSGAMFLAKLSRQPKQIADIVADLAREFGDVPVATLEADFREFAADLETDGFVVSGRTPAELDREMPRFSYQMTNPKTMPLTRIDMSQTPLTSTAEFMAEHFRKIPRVFGLQMEVTARCNERCQHCYLPHDRNMAEMETSLALDILDQLVPMGTVSVTISGGECLLHKDIDQILRRARKNDLMISVLSNITLLTDEHVALLKEVNIAQLQVSLYSMKAEEHDAITQLPGSHAKTLRALEKLIAADIPAQISCPVMRINQHFYRDVMAWAYQHRIKAYTDFIMMARTDFSTSNLEHRLNPEEAETLMRGMLDYDLEYRAILDAKIPPETPEVRARKPVCGVGVDSLCVAADGNYYPCSGFQGYALGNAKQQRLQEVWEGSPAIHKLRQITNASFPDCLQCVARPFCNMCLVRNFNGNGGDMFKVSRHFCDIAFLNKKIVEEYWQQQAATAK
ncbi:MAG: PqqD family peptide modification chaperone [Kiritimatiellaeota bacterium]|nr:PqqD family peptide modification chaperone [Kiritimatiellota bacterium]